MPERRQKLRGPTALLDSTAGLQGLLTVNTSDYSLRVFDGVLVGGYPILNRGQNDTRYAPISRLVSTAGGSGLQGGGALGANLNLSVDNTVVRTSGTQLISGGNTRFETPLSIVGPAGVAMRALDFREQSDMSIRWRIAANPTVEGPPNLGSDLDIYRYNNSGASPALIARFSGFNSSLTVTGLVTASTFIGDGSGLVNVPDTALPSTVVRTTRTLTAGNGLTGGGTLAADRTLTLGTPSAITTATGNTVTGTTHTHALTLTAADAGALAETVVVGGIGSLLMGFVSGSDTAAPGTVRAAALVTRAFMGSTGNSDTTTAAGGTTWRQLGSVNATNRVTLMQRVT